MAEGSAERRLAAIIIADVVGYSKLIQADEQGTRARFKQLQDELFTPSVTSHGGRVIKTMGDAFLLEFPSAVEAVTCAHEIQQELQSLEADSPPESRIQFRIGINVGDIIVEGEDIHGDGVNVAARLEELSDPGGILISATVHDQVRDKLDFAMEDRGEVEVKNIARPVRVFRVLAGGEAATVAKPARPKWLMPAIAAAVLLVAVIGGGAWWWSQQPDFDPADPKKFAYKLPDKPSIAVLAFDYLGADKKEHGYLAKGLSENIVTALSQIPEMFVIARGSSFAFKGKAIDVRKVSEQLGVRYVLKGRVQWSGKNLRVTAQLVDAVDGKYLWAETFDRTIDDIFRTQDDITKSIAVALQLNIGNDPGAPWVAKGTKNLKAWSLVLRSRPHFFKFIPEENNKAGDILAQAIALDKSYAYAWLMLAHVRAQKYRWAKGPDRKQYLTEAFEAIDMSLKLDPTSSGAVMAKAWFLNLKGDFAAAVRQGEAALTLSPNISINHATFSSILRFAGHYERSAAMMQRAMRLHPRHPTWYFLNLGITRMISGRYKEVVELWRKNRSKLRSNARVPEENLIIAYHGLGNFEKAKQTAKVLLREVPNYSVEHFRNDFPIKDKKRLAEMASWLKAAGIPEYPPGKKGPKAKATKPSIAVLPFANLSGDKEQEYFADGMTDDLITDLSKVSGLNVIARNSVFTYKGKNVKVQDIAKDLNVTHVIEGSVRRAGGQVRINAQLIDAKTGNHLWAETFDRAYKDIFKLQDEISGRIIAAMKVNLSPEDKLALAKLSTKDVIAYEHFLKAEALRINFNFKKFDDVIEDYQAALKRDPNFVSAWFGLAQTLFEVWNSGMAEAMPDPTQAVGQARKALAKVEALEPGHQKAALLNIQILTLSGELEKALSVAEANTIKNPDNPNSHFSVSWVLMNLGRLDAALQAAERALSLSSQMDIKGLEDLAFGFAYLGDGTRAKDLVLRARKIGGGKYKSAWPMLMAHLLLGDPDAAKQEFAVITSRWKAANLNFIRVLYQQFRDPEIGERWFMPLVKAGMPDWPNGITFDESKRVKGDEFAALFKPPYQIEGAVFNVTEIKNDKICIVSTGSPMGRTYCTPVYRDPAYIKKHAETTHEYIAPEIHYGFQTFSVKRIQ